MKTSDFNYHLPQDLIAQNPAEKRESSRMMLISRIDGTIQDSQFLSFIDHLRMGDVLVLNDTQVINARLFGHKSGHYQGAKCEFLLLSPLSADFTRWEAYAKPAKRMKTGSRIRLIDKVEKMIDPLAEIELLSKREDGSVEIKLHTDMPPLFFLEKYGYLPLPPYIERLPTEMDQERYQTVFAHFPGAVAAPTAGLHFTSSILEKIAQKGVEILYITLHTGAGTFKPVTVEDPTQHKMHTEHFILSKETAQKINQAKVEKRRIIAVGTTTVRVLESCATDEGMVSPQESDTNIFLYPPYHPKVVDGLLTNFHLPKSTLLMLVSTFVSREKILRAYTHAVEKKYRFYSYGDCMFITPENL